MSHERIVIPASGNSISHCLAAVRRHFKIPLKGNRESMRSGGEDNLWRVHLESGIIVECTLIKHSKAEVHV